MKKTFSFITLLSVVALTLFSFSAPASAQNVGSLQSVVTPGFSFKKDLRVGDTDPDVRELQRVLNADVDTVITSEGEGSRGKETTYFGEKTKLAVIKLQNKYKDVVLTLNSITNADGAVNKATRTRLNLLIGVINTYDSVGISQSRAGAVTTTTTVTRPVIVSTPVVQTQPQMTVCQFVELLVNINVIAPTKANSARSALGCSINTRPTVNLKVNNSSGRVIIPSARNVNVSWTSSGVTSCSAVGRSKPTSGSESVYIGESAKIMISCSGPKGSAVDEVDIIIGSNSDLITSCSPSATSIMTGDSLTWTATTTGGSGDYGYSWSGTDGLSGTNSSVSHFYDSTGLKNAQVVVTSGSKNNIAVCMSMVNSSTVLATSTATSSEPVYLDFQVQPVNNIDSYFITWEAKEATNCKVSTLPALGGWNNTNKSNTGFEIVTITESTVFTMTCNNSLYSDFASAVAQYTPLEEVASTTDETSQDVGSVAGFSTLSTDETSIGDEYAVRGDIAEVKKCDGSDRYYQIKVRSCDNDSALEKISGPTTSSGMFGDGPVSDTGGTNTDNIITDNTTNSISGAVKKNVVTYFDSLNQKVIPEANKSIMATTFKNTENDKKTSDFCPVSVNAPTEDLTNGGWIKSAELDVAMCPPPPPIDRGEECVAGNEGTLGRVCEYELNVFGVLGIQWGGNKGWGLNVLGNTLKLNSEEGRIFGLKLW